MTAASFPQTINHVIDYKNTLDVTFSALSAAPRRALLHDLLSGPRTVSELAAGRPISLQAVSKHLQVLESAGLVTKQRRGKESLCRLRPEAFDEAAGWIDVHRRLWEDGLDRLEAVMDDMEGDAG